MIKVEIFWRAMEIELSLFANVKEHVICTSKGAVGIYRLMDEPTGTDKEKSGNKSTDKSLYATCHNN